MSSEYPLPWWFAEEIRDLRKHTALVIILFSVAVAIGLALIGVPWLLAGPRGGPKPPDQSPGYLVFLAAGIGGGAAAGALIIAPAWILEIVIFRLTTKKHLRAWHQFEAAGVELVSKVTGEDHVKMLRFTCSMSSPVRGPVLLVRATKDLFIVMQNESLTFVRIPLLELRYETGINETRSTADAEYWNRVRIAGAAVVLGAPVAAAFYGFERLREFAAKQEQGGDLITARLMHQDRTIAILTVGRERFTAHYDTFVSTVNPSGAAS